MREAVARYASEFGNLPFKFKWITVGEIILSYVFPIVGVVLFFILRKLRKNSVYIYSGLVSAIVALFIYCIDFIFTIATNTL